jgi:hypothetical protein
LRVRVTGASVCPRADATPTLAAIRRVVKGNAALVFIANPRQDTGANLRYWLASDA